MPTARRVRVADIVVPSGRRSLGDVATLADSMRELGLLNPITVSENLVLVAGYHRLEACRALGWTEIDARVVDLVGLRAELAEIDENLVRNDLTALERAEQLARRKAVYEALHPQTKQGGDRRSEEAKSNSQNDSLIPSFVEDTAKKTGQSKPTVYKDVQIATAIPQPVRDAIRATPVADSKTDLLALARMDKPEQTRVAEKIATAEAKTVKEAQSQIIREARDARRDEIVEAGETPLPSGRYRCLVVDPPWPMAKIDRDERPNQGNALDYPVMSLDEIANLPVADLAEADGCHLYLWTTQKFLPAALRLVEGWGFRYQCLMTWVKPTGMTPYSWMYNTEHVIFARCGSLDLLRMGLKLSFEAPVTRHSEKPEVFYDRVAAASPGPRLELFARTQRLGFVAWGNEVPAVAA